MGRIEAGYESAGLSARRLQMLRYATALTRDPAAMAAEDVQSLRDVGFADADVLAIAEVVAYYAYANRIVDGLGVLVESAEAE